MPGPRTGEAAAAIWLPSSLHLDEPVLEGGNVESGMRSATRRPSGECGVGTVFDRLLRQRERGALAIGRERLARRSSGALK